MNTLAGGLNIPCNEPKKCRKTTSKGGLSANIGELGLQSPQISDRDLTLNNNDIRWS